MRRSNLKNTFIFVVFIIISYLITFYCLAHPDIIFSSISLTLFNSLSSLIFIYLFNHQNYFPAIKNIELSNQKKQKKYLKKFLKFGKFIATILTGLIGGPILLSLSVKLLFRQHQYRYTIIASILTNIVFIIISKGLLQIIF